MEPDELDGQLGMILGAVVAMLRRTDHSAEEIHRWVDLAVRSHELSEDVLREGARDEEGRR